MDTRTQTQTQPQPRLPNLSAAGETYLAMRALQQVVNGSSLEPLLLELVKVRASQINGCAFCIDMHVREAQQKGETPHRLHLLPAWHELDIYSRRERAALRWTEVLTRLSDGAGVPDEIYEEASAEFTKQELLELTLAIIAINGWNRLNVAFRIPPTLAPAGRKA